MQKGVGFILNDEIDTHFFMLKFADKAEWNNFKEDLKNILRENQIKFQYSEKTPTFHILYKSNQIHLRIDWRDEDLIVMLNSLEDISPEDLNACNEIFDLLNLFSGELIDGTTPYEW